VSEGWREAVEREIERAVERLTRLDDAIAGRLSPGRHQALTVAVVSEGIDLACTPPCEINTRAAGHAGLCGKPSVVRLRVMFPCCEAVYALFVCDECLRHLKDLSWEWYCDGSCNIAVIPEWTVI
jgi:hypothetical protein